MAENRKIRVAVLYGGRSGEHEVSLRSAASVVNQLDRERFEIVLVAIDKSGRWLLNDRELIQGASALPIFKDQEPVVLPPNPHSGATALMSFGGTTNRPGAGVQHAIDVVFPVMHGTYCEDGTIQGLLELADVPYVGSGVLGSAVCMDKEVAKRLAREAGIPVVPWVSVTVGAWARDPAALEERIARDLGFPCFIKPANNGSSVGVHKVKERANLRAAIEDALRYDIKVLAEKAISAREIELSVLENSKLGESPLVSVPGEVVPTHEFYSYEAKYLDENGAALHIPARLDAAQIAQVQKLAAQSFVALECEGMGRVDFFLDKQTGQFYLNEINTLPGFTSISMYPKMWEATGIPYKELLTRLLELAIARHERKARLVRDFQAK